jgi:hypothetical protein
MKERIDLKPEDVMTNFRYMNAKQVIDELILVIGRDELIKYLASSNEGVYIKSNLQSIYKWEKDFEPDDIEDK